MQSSIDIPLANGWHVTIFGPAMWLLVVAAAGLVAVAVKALRVRFVELPPAWAITRAIAWRRYAGRAASRSRRRRVGYKRVPRRSCADDLPSCACWWMAVGVLG